jgi:hypothetical protein
VDSLFEHLPVDLGSIFVPRDSRFIVSAFGFFI